MQENPKKVNRNSGGQKAARFKVLKVKSQPPKNLITRRTLENES